MQINTLLDETRKYLVSAFFPITIGVLSLLCWLLPGNWVYFPAVFYALICFLPLISKEGKCYLPLYLFLIILPNSPLLLNGIPGEVLLTGIALILSSILFLILRKPKLKKGELFYPLLSLTTVLLISYLYNMIKDGSNDFRGILYILAFYSLLILSIFFFTTLGNEESLPYFSSTVSALDAIIVSEVIVSLFYDNSTTPLVWSTFRLGWTMNGTTACTLLTLSLPFLSMNIAKKRYQTIAISLYTILGILLISSYSALIALLFSIVPLIFLSFRTYGNKYPYLVLTSLVLTGTVLILLIGFNKTANANILNALKSLNPIADIPEGKVSFYRESIEEFFKNPVLGISTAGRVQNDGTISFSGNSILTSLVFGGIFALLAFLFFDIYIYVISMKKKTSERMFFLVFLVMQDVIGYLNDTLYLIPVFLFYLLAVIVYQMSNRPQDTVVHQDFFENYHPGENLDRR